MRKRSNVDNLDYFDACAVYSSDSRFATVTGTFDISFDFAETEIGRDFSEILSCHLGSVGGILL